ncbi:lytic transglycosylase domain-containing protein [Microbaculum marinum]|uniref:Lytic transglycosylase domain-containing protein n=1 Tax=Microbaculum marinum TaxID=1764581 RepID=A0AAW9RBX1_9HYPH
MRTIARCVLAAWLSMTSAAQAEESPPDGVETAAPAPPSRADICAYIEQAAGDHGLPVSFLTRLIWRESSFRPWVVSPKGAQGIAQFMPATAAERGLADPFDPEPAIAAAASFLTDLRELFGNLGLAAAAYNGGPNRISGWLAGTDVLPAETHQFVRIITGRMATDWRAPDGGPVPADPPESARPTRCLDVVASIARPSRTIMTAGPDATAPWGAQVAGHFSRDRALSIYSNLQQRYDAVLADRAPMVVGTRNRSRGAAVFFDVRVPAETKQEAADLCALLRARGAACIVRKS